MIIGIGVDIVEIQRIRELLNRGNAFLEKIFTIDEIVSLRNRNFRPEFVAARFAAKEAVSKALGTGIRGFSFKDIIIFNDELGKPLVKLTGKAEEIANSYGKIVINLSISHEINSAIAFAILQEANNG